MRRHAAVAAAMALAVSLGCSSGGLLSLRSTPHDQYLAMLHRSGLDGTTLGRQWQAAGATAMQNAASIGPSFSEAGYFPAEQPMAVAYRLQLQRGRRLTVEVRFEASEPGSLFVDLFRTEGDGQLRHVAALDADQSSLDYPIDRTATFVLRLQPELLRSGRFTISGRTLAALRTFPVDGLTHRAIQSGFGAVRDSGTRMHEGIDIFAARGTAVVAVADGIARRDTNALGGNVVWLRESPVGGVTYYYAHLDRWGMDGSVREGDLLGYVGNTGNARTTSPHLHFGIYGDGAVDPAPFLSPDDSVPVNDGDVSQLGMLVRTRTVRTPLREGPSAGTAERLMLERDTLARRMGVAGAWHRVVLPDGVAGYVAATSVTAGDRPLRRSGLAAPLALREKPAANAAVVQTLGAGEDVEWLGRFRQFDFVRPASGLAGWTER